MDHWKTTSHKVVNFSAVGQCQSNANDHRVPFVTWQVAGDFGYYIQFLFVCRWFLFCLVWVFLTAFLTPISSSINNSLLLGYKIKFAAARAISEQNIFAIRILYITETLLENLRCSESFLGKCEDSHQHCKVWSEMNECTKNKAWMSVSCRKSCKQCGKFSIKLRYFSWYL